MIRVFGAVVRQGRMEYKKLRLTAIPKGQSAKLKCLVRRSKVSRGGTQHTQKPRRALLTFVGCIGRLIRNPAIESQFRDERNYLDRL
jgi:hypothetical protein